MHELLFVTSNANKVAKIQAVLGRPLQQIDLDLPEVQAVDVKEVIEQKAREAYRQVGKPVLVEDTGLAFDAWNGLPGALIRWFLKTVGNASICTMLDGFADRRAVAETCIGFYDGVNFVAFSGYAPGVITTSPRGEQGFGWDPIFQPDGSTKTFAELAPDEKRAVDMRRDAALQLRAYLATREEDD
ncbi:MAG: non-canonical purine NTP pyrophosphatase [Caldilineaceae bacterium]